MRERERDRMGQTLNHKYYLKSSNVAFQMNQPFPLVLYNTDTNAVESYGTNTLDWPERLGYSLLTVGSFHMPKPCFEVNRKFRSAGGRSLG